MKRRQSGQALIMALILLAIGTVIIVPSLTLTQNAVKNSRIVNQRAHDFYSADAAQEFVLWKLLYTNYVSQFTYDGQRDDFSVDVCGTPVGVSVIMRALASFRGVTLIGDTPIRPTKTVTPNINPGGANLTYRITLEQVSDNTSQGLDAVYDILPKDFVWADYITGSSRLRVDGGAWVSIADPGYNVTATQVALRWPASGNFTSPTRDFTVGQVKEIEFKMKSTGLKSNRVYYNWVVLKPWNTLSGATANITIAPGGVPEGGLMALISGVVPNFVPPGVTTNVTYTLNITNQQGATDWIEKITNYLPPGFEYVGPASGLTTDVPTANYTLKNGIWRWELVWDLPGGDVKMDSLQTRSLIFTARTSENVSGSYFNETLVQTRNGVPNIFQNIGVTQQNFASGYSWNSAAVVVPAYDTSSQAGNVTVNANLATTRYGVAISSFQVR